MNSGQTTDYTPDQVADLLGISKTTVMDQVRAKAWPHQRYTARQIRFTPEQVQAIRDLAAVTPDDTPEPRPAPPAAGAMFDRVARHAS